MTISASERVRQGPLGLICVFSPSSIRCEAASGPSRANLRTLVRWIPKFRSGGSSPRAPWGSVGVGCVSCITPSSVSATRGVELIVTHLDGSSNVLSELANGHVRAESGSIIRDRVGKALVWHSAAP